MAILFKTIYLDKNQGHGNARRISVTKCSNELVALMDADDISQPLRFELQLNEFKKNNKLDICGGYITEFVGAESNIVGRRQVKRTDIEIKKDLKKRCPMNQVTVMFKRKTYDLAGGYIDLYCEEDYYLWTRMIQKNAVFTNIEYDIVNVRTGLDMSSRRGGLKYFKSEKIMQKYLLKNKFISFPRYLYNILIRFCGEVLSPNWLRNILFKFTRKKVTEISLQKNTEMNNLEEIPDFSVAMCVYGKDNPDWFDRALESISVNQKYKPSEIVLVVDGPIPDSIQNVIDKYDDICKKI